MGISRLKADCHSAQARECQIPRGRRASVRGDTYGVICIVIFTLLLAAAIIAGRFLSAGAITVSSRPSSPTAAPIDPPARTPSAAPVTPTPAKPTSTTFASLIDGLAYSQTLAATRLIGRGTISPRAGGFSETFQYERLKNLERIQVAGGNFVRNIGGAWVRSDGWSTTGTPASPSQVSMLNDLMGMTNAAWSPRSPKGPVTALEPPKEESSFKVIYSVPTDSPGQQIFTFRKINSHLQLERFSGLVGSGPDQVQLRIDYAYPTDVKGTTVSPTTPSPRPRARPVARKTPSKAKRKAARQPSPRKSASPQ